MDLQAKAQADFDNPQFAAAALERLKEAVHFEIALKLLKGLNPDQQFITKIEL